MTYIFWQTANSISCPHQGAYRVNNNTSKYVNYIALKEEQSDRIQLDFVILNGYFILFVDKLLIKCGIFQLPKLRPINQKTKAFLLGQQQLCHFQCSDSGEKCVTQASQSKRLSAPIIGQRR